MERADGASYRFIGFSPLDLPGALDELQRDLRKFTRIEAVLCHRADLEVLRAKLPGLPVVAEAAPRADHWPGGPLPKTVWVA